MVGGEDGGFLLFSDVGDRYNGSSQEKRWGLDA